MAGGLGGRGVAGIVLTLLASAADPIDPGGGTPGRGTQSTVAALASDPSAAALQRDALWERFPAFVWRRAPRRREPAPALLAGLGGIHVQGPEAPAWLDADSAFYVGHGPGRNTLHLDRDAAYVERRAAWIESRATEGLVRSPCLSDPETAAALAQELDRSLAARDGRHGIGISLGDEVSLTPWGDPLDFCRGPACEAAWSARRAAAPSARGRARADRPAPTEPAPFPSTDAARLALVAGELAQLEPWLDRRRLHQAVLLERLTELADRIRAASPETGVGLLGIAGETAFGGVPLERVLPLLDFVEPYAVGDARELVATLRQPHQRVLATLALDAIDPEEAVARVYEHWQRGVDGLVIYSDRELEQDLPTRDRLADAMGWVRGARASLAERSLQLRPVPMGVALLHDADSQRVAWLRDAAREGPRWCELLAGYQERTGTFETARWRWLRALEDAGTTPGALPLGDLSASTFDRFQALVACHLEVLGRDDRSRLERFLEAGGTLFVEGRFATLQRSGDAWNEDVREQLQLRFGDRVRGVPPGLERYAQARVHSASAGAAFRSNLQSALDAATVERPPLALPSDSGPWLVASQPCPDGWIVAVRASTGTPAERRAPAELPARPGHTVEWLVGPGAPVAVARILSTEASPAPEER